MTVKIFPYIEGYSEENRRRTRSLLTNSTVINREFDACYEPNPHMKFYKCGPELKVVRI